MANTVIQIKRSSSTSVPTNGSLAAAEPAYSYLSDKLFIGDSSGSGVIEIGGRYYSNLTIQAYTQANTAKDIAVSAFDAANASASGAAAAAFDKANSANIIASAAFDKANSANVLAYNTGIGANAYAESIGTAGNNYTNSVGTAGNNYTNTVGTAANNYAAAVGVAANSYAAAVGVGANSYSDSTFVKLTAPNQTITGNLTVTGTLSLVGNTIFANVETLRINDPLIYLAGNNYTSDTVDIGFIGNYVNATGSNVHTGFYREHINKEYYLFQEYAEEPFNNHIDSTGNNFTLAVLNAHIRTTNLVLSGINVYTWIENAYNKANSANLLAYNTGLGANAYASAVGVSANAYSSAVGVAANSYASAVGIAANLYSDLVGQAANTNAANATYLTTGTVPSARLSGSYTGITGVGTLTAGTWNADVITVPYGGTGTTSFTANGILFGNTTGAIKVTAAGTEGQVLQASATGAPLFAHLDGGNF